MASRDLAGRIARIEGRLGPDELTRWMNSLSMEEIDAAIAELKKIISETGPDSKETTPC